jgi:hypothetical protein
LSGGSLSLRRRCHVCPPLNARVSPHCCACAAQAHSTLWVSQPLWGSANGGRRASTGAPISSPPRPFTSSRPSKSASQIGSPRATKLASQNKPGLPGGAGAARRQQQQQLAHNVRPRSCSAPQSQIEIQIAGMRADLLAKAKGTASHPISLSNSEQPCSALTYAPSAMSAPLLAQRAAVVARLDAAAAKYRAAAVKDGSMRRLMRQQSAISVDLGYVRGAYARTDTAMASATAGWQPIRLFSNDARTTVPYTPNTMPASLLAQRAAVVARLDAKAWHQYRAAAVKDGSMRRLVLKQRAIAGDLERVAHTVLAVVDGLIRIQDLCDGVN